MQADVVHTWHQLVHLRQAAAMACDHPRHVTVTLLRLACVMLQQNPEAEYSADHSINASPQNAAGIKATDIPSIHAD